MYIKYSSYCIDNNNDLHIFITDLNGDEYKLATISNCAGMTTKEIAKLIDEILEEKGIIDNEI